MSAVRNLNQEIFSEETQIQGYLMEALELLGRAPSMGSLKKNQKEQHRSENKISTTINNCLISLSEVKEWMI